METTKVILQGGGEHARVVLDALLAASAQVIALYDPNYTGTLMGIEQRGNYSADVEPEAKMVIAIGNNATRKKIAEHATHQFTNAIHPSAIISPSASVGLGVMILHGAIIQAQTKVDDHTIINTGAQIDHDCVISKYVHIGPGAILCGTVQIGEGTFVGAGATIIPGRTIGKWATVGAGSVVLTHVPDYAVVVGNPARIIKYNKP